MTLLKNAYLLTISQRKAMAILLMAVALTNSQVTTARAADLGSLVIGAQAETAAYEKVLTVPKSEPSQAPAEIPASEPTVQEVLLRVCEDNGYGEDCAKTLLGMLWNESSNRSNVIGDNGKARGYFQIHYRLHKISIACAEDLVCSANWTIKYLERNSYPRYVNYAVQCHNSCNVANGYAAKAMRNARNLWDKPLAINQAAPIILAMK